MKKEFDAVEMMRHIREKLHKQYEQNPKLRKKRLQEVRKKYGIDENKKEKIK
jgi:hypothetical protein